MSDIAKTDEVRLGGIFKTSLGILGRRLLPIIVVTILAYVPANVAVVVIPVATRGWQPSTPVERMAYGVVGLIGPFLILAAGSLATGMVMYGVVQVLRRRRFPVGESVGVVVRRVVPLIGITVCTQIAIALALMLLIVPGLMLLCRWYVSIPACMAEGTGVFASMARSRDLTKGHRWRVFGAIVLPATVVTAIFIGAVSFVPVSVLTAPQRVELVVMIVALGVGVMLFTAFANVLAAVLYYRLRLAKEGVDIDKIAGVFD